MAARRKPARGGGGGGGGGGSSNSINFGSAGGGGHGSDDDEGSLASEPASDAAVSSASFLHRAGEFLRESLVLPLTSMYFVMLLINTILRDTKDTMLVNSVAGVAAIPILKSWVTIPSSLVFFLFYSRLSHSRLTQRSQFVVLLLCFSGFYLLFAAAVYPFRKYYSPRAFAARLRAQEPHSAVAAFASVVEEWTLGLFYIVSELWSSVVCQLMFWQVANDVVTIRAAKDIYPIIGACGNLGLVVAGRLLLVFADRRDLDSARAYLRIIEHHRPKNASAAAALLAAETPYERVIDEMDPAETAWLGTLLGIALLVFLGSAFIVVCYDDVYKRMRLYHPLMLQQKEAQQAASPIRKTVSGSALANTATAATTTNSSGTSTNTNTTPAATNHKNNTSNTLEKRNMSTWEALSTLSKSEPLRLVATLVVSYGVSSSLIEVSWKGQVKHVFFQSGEYSRFMGSFWTWTGLSSMACMVLSSAMLRKLGYRVAVVFTPLAMMFAGGVFFAVSVYVAIMAHAPPPLQEEHGGGHFLRSPVLSSGRTLVVAMPDHGSSSANLKIAAYAGAFAVLIAKSAKYAVFDATKEMMFIPLDKESKGVGKAAIDVVAYRLAKSGGSVALQLVLLAFGSLDDLGLIPIGALFSIIVVVWLNAAYATGKMVHEAQRSEIQRDDGVHLI